MSADASSPGADEPTDEQPRQVFATGAGDAINPHPPQLGSPGPESDNPFNDTAASAADIRRGAGAEPNNNNLKQSVVASSPVKSPSPGSEPTETPVNVAGAQIEVFDGEVGAGDDNLNESSPPPDTNAKTNATTPSTSSQKYTSSVVIECAANIKQSEEEQATEEKPEDQSRSCSSSGSSLQQVIPGEQSLQTQDKAAATVVRGDKRQSLAGSYQRQVSASLDTRELQEEHFQQHAFPDNSATCDNNNTCVTPISQTQQQQLHHTQQQQHQDNNNNTYNDKRKPFLERKQLQDQQQQQFTCKRKQLTSLQRLLLRKWPFLALGLCTMGSLIFGMLLSALTVYLLHGLTDCSGLGLTPVAGPGGRLHPPPLSAGSGSDFDTAMHHEGQFAALAAPPPALQATEPKRASFQRLPANLWPSHYDLFMQPFIWGPHFNFTGRVAIQLWVSAPTDRIQLHIHDLRVDNVTLSSGSMGPATPKIRQVSADTQMQYLVVQLDAPLQVGANYSLAMNFYGFLNEDLNGFYRIRYEQPESKETTWIAATQFQATDARRAFPCFDEPSHKATFSIQIKHWKNMTALSNMPIVNRQDSSDGLWVTDTFDRTPRMSTYLVAFAVTNFESRSQGNISVWARPGLSHTAEYALQVAGRILRFYEEFFGIEYPLPKVDMIALPDFNAGAMENWGLITFRETAMLYDNTSSSIVNKQRVAVVVAHELAHQWFGNLVTPKWWDDLWLNEGFASYVEYIGVNSVEPMWRMQDQFVIEEVQNVFRLDGLSSSHQISIPVNNPEEISEIFDQISYAKGASVIRMMNYFLTEPVFKAGLKTYLNELKYSNAEQGDLWRHLTAAHQKARQEVSGPAQALQRSGGPSSGQEQIDVEKVMNSWTLQVGFPLVTVTRRYDGSGVAQLNQARYRSYKLSNNDTSELEQKWEIPITYTWKSEQNWTPNTRLWLHPNSSGPTETVRADKVPDNDWLLVNIHQVGYYRVNYDQRNWRLLIDQLNVDHKQISLTNRAQILDDLFELARSGQLDYRFAMESTKYLKAERDYMPWDTVLTSFSYIDDMLQRTAIYGDWKDYILGLITPYYARYKNGNWLSSSGAPLLGDNSSSLASPTTAIAEADSNDILEHFNLVNSIGWACQVDDHCIERAKSLFAQWRKSSRNNIKPALRYTVYCTAIENGNKNDWEFLWRAYALEQNASEKDRILRALACSKEHWLLKRYLEEAFSKDSKQIRRQDGSSVFRTVARNNYGRDLAFNFMRERWSTIRDYYAKSSFSFGNLIRSVSNSMNTRLELNQLKAFYESVKNEVGTGKRAFQIAIEDVETNVLWNERNYQIIEDWLKETRTKASS